MTVYSTQKRMPLALLKCIPLSSSNLQIREPWVILSYPLSHYQNTRKKYQEYDKALFNSYQNGPQLTDSNWNPYTCLHSSI